MQFAPNTAWSVPTCDSHCTLIRYGIECVEELTWHKWQLGGEYTKTLVVKNVSQQVQKITYKLPASKMFSMEYPVPLKLSPGMSHTIRVRALCSPCGSPCNPSSHAILTLLHPIPCPQWQHLSDSSGNGSNVSA